MIAATYLYELLVYLTREMQDKMTEQTLEEAILDIGKSKFTTFIIIAFGFYYRFVTGIVTLSPVFVAGKQAYSCASYQDLFNGSNNQCKTKGLNDSHILCDKWNYNTAEYESTIISQFNLVCSNDFLRSLTSTFFFFGFLIGSTFYGMISDKFGRKLGFIITSLHQGVCLIACAYIPNYWGYVISQMLLGWGTGGMLTVTFTYLAELSNVKNRLFIIANASNGWSVGAMLLSLIAYMIRSHFMLQVVISSFAFFGIFLALLIVESPRWLYNNGQISEAEKALSRICRFTTCDKNFAKKCFVLVRKKSSIVNKGSIMDLLRTRYMRRNTLILWFDWTVVSMAYYAISLNVGQLGGNIYINNLIGSAIEVLGRVIIFLLNIRFGRIHAIVVTFLFGGLITVICAFLYKEAASAFVTATIVLMMLGKLAIVMCFELLWLYTAECIPTSIRNTGLGAASTWARFGAMIAPQTFLLQTAWSPLPYIIIGVLPIICSTMSFMLPETRNKIIPETLEQGEKFAKGVAVENDEEHFPFSTSST